MSKKTLSQIIIDKIIEVNGIGSPVFGICGIGTYSFDEPLQNALDKKLLTYFYTSNESSGINLAAYWGAINDKIGIHFCTSGPGIVMGITAIDSIFNEGKPCVIFTGQPHDSYFEYVDPRIMHYLSSGCFSIKDKNANVNNILTEAFKLAKYGTYENPKSGPVVIFVNDDLWLEKFNDHQITINPKLIWRQDVSHFMSKINNSINSDSKVILRIGSSVNIENTKTLVELTKYFPNFYIHLTYKSKNNFNGVNSTYSNVGIEGNLGNPFVNKNYNEADVVITLGISYNETYYLWNYGDISKMTKHGTKLWYIVNGVELFLPKYITKSNSINTEINFFITKWIKDISKSLQKPTVAWKGDMNEKNLYWWKIIDKYIKQEEHGYLSTASVIAQCLNEIYKLQKDNKYAIIDDNTIYGTDAGTSSFIFMQLLNHARPYHQLSYFQFCPIGIGPAGLAGYLKSGKYNDGFLIIGDGGFTNSPGYFMELVNVVGEFKNMRCLILLVNDKSYTNVKIEEIQEFGHSTSITSTKQNQKFINYYELLKAFTGNLFRESLCIENLKKPSDKLSEFMSNWYLKKSGFDKGGFYIVNYITPATPVFYTSTGEQIP